MEEEDDAMNRYRSLQGVLNEAFERAAFGKGSKRHDRGGENFIDQYIIRGAEMYGIAGLYFQLNKKLEESFRMSGQQRINELLDIVVYAAAAVLVTRRKESIGRVYPDYDENKISH